MNKFFRELGDTIRAGIEKGNKSYREELQKEYDDLTAMITVIDGKGKIDPELSNLAERFGDQKQDGLDREELWQRRARVLRQLSRLDAEPKTKGGRF